MQAKYTSAIQQFEGFTPKAKWDYAQHTNGFGTRAQYPGEQISSAEASERFAKEIADAKAAVDRFAPTLDEGSKAALTSLTFNAGTAWMDSGLGAAVRSGELDKAKSIFLDYNKAGGETLPGLVARRAAEAEWFGADPKTATSREQPRIQTAALNVINQQSNDAVRRPNYMKLARDDTPANENSRSLGYGSAESYLSWLALTTAKAMRSDGERDALPVPTERDHAGPERKSDDLLGMS